jgi:hypothetical protein
MIITCCKLNTGKHTEDNYVNLGPVRPWKDISCMVKTVYEIFYGRTRNSDLFIQVTA